MRRPRALWKFTKLVDPVRRRRLLAVENFEEVIEGILRGTIVPLKQSPRGEYKRAVFRIFVDESAYDAFFNSPCGYRGQYCISVQNGESQNRRLIDILMPHCLRSCKDSEARVAANIRASLEGRDAKVWIDEDEDSVLDVTGGPHINYPPWIAKANAAYEGTSADQAARARAFPFAPVGRRLELKGAWLGPDGCEWRDPSKANRAQEIHDYGYS